MKTRFLPALLLGAALVAGPIACTSDTETEIGMGTEIGINTAAMDTSLVPGDDFYGYANGTWQRDTEIPADRSSIGAFLVAFNQTERQVTEMIGEIVASDPEPGTDEARIADFYNAFMDVDAINAADMEPVQADIERFEAIENPTQLSRVLGEQLRADVDPLNYTDYQTENLLGLFVTQGLATPGEVLPYLLQGGLGMPEREYYLSADPSLAAIRTEYRAYIEELLAAAGIDNAPQRAQRIFDLEMQIAEAHNTREQTEDFAQSATVWNRDELDSRAPGMDWDAFLTAAQLNDQEKFAAYQADGIAGLSGLVASQPIESWQDWLIFHQINSHAAVLPSAIDEAHFAFYGTTLSGTPEQRSRDKRALSSVNQYLGDAVGRLYAERYFPASARDEVQAMVDNITDAFAERVRNIEWMADETRAEALRKVETIIVGVGYSDNWRDYSDYAVSADNAYAAMIDGERAEYAHQRAKLGQPMDRGEWWMTPQTVNAVNLPVQNALNFPAAILQPPFFNAAADPAFNYGAIGAVIGHEISHSFDNNGAAFDSTGALRNWWTEEDLASFNQQGDALAAQYDAYAPFPDLNVNGRLTLGENIADVAGLQAAYDAYRASLNGEEAPVIDGFTGDQRFFIAYAQTWATKMRDEALRQRVQTDGHAPGMYRALTVRNLDAWYDAFDVQPDAELYLAPEDRVRVW
ncbi:M13 family metallopeptidase [Parasphingopyxis lamellibrachiae]|uniref:Endothelin-converting enzyme/putative endopeptidase n=1 Tax=Parasphingopyxis lamellibrachiae TaxID=680125 RepID=A0A3D9FBH2_9SPHN|nr:M13 family metallopeptidase [Parasphingopyxis lamellibrachiae]RED15179.1 endothelin-converting enzyme/putative endopeptidase [Parasphingopyxis lamellibrachiae]